MKTLLLLALLFVSPHANAWQFFENAVRRDGNTREAHPMVAVTAHYQGGGSSSCAGFFVKNTGNKALIATARHCMAYQMTRWCEAKGGLRFRTQLGGHVGTCKRVVAAASHLDFGIVEAEFENWSTLKDQVHYLQLSAQRPREGTRLKMIGYPGDPARQGEFTTTENCWISNGRLVETSDLSAAELQRNLEWRSRATGAPNPLADQIRFNHAARHNCSVYGGNSGGPILVHNTPIVLGLPTRYFPGATEPKDESLTTTMDSTVDFIEAQRDQLREAGVVLARPYKN